jgi:hypothetical protein
MQRIKKPRINTPEYTAYVNKLMIELYEKSLKEKEQEKIYEDIPFAEKEIAKQFGAKWCKDRKSWYFTDRNSWEEFVNY